MGNALQRDLFALVGEKEAGAAATPRRWAQHFHLMPPVGWLNDPNGLHQRDGVFHAYFQYAPFDVAGGVKMWGHSVSRDLVSWEYEGCALVPDEPFDCHGVYSGSALAHDGRVSMFYTGSVKLPDAEGAYDYISTGREGNTVMVDTADGSAFGEKRLLMTNSDYPSDLTCHVRDPKVWRADAACGRYLMVLGARRRVEGPASAQAPACAGDERRRALFRALHGERWGSDVGEVLVFSSDDLTSWRLQNRISTPERFGFMWECPDYFELRSVVPACEGAVPASMQVLSVSPQGLSGERWARRNLYQSGYFVLEGDLCGECELGAFRLWDAGFDFYAPQTFEAQDGRRILIGWMGMPDDPTYGNDPTIAEGWQHCFTVPREISCGADGTVRQAPVRELANLRGAVVEGRGEVHLGDAPEALDIEIRDVSGVLSVLLGGELEVGWEASADDGPRFSMRFADASRTSAGCGRTVRWERVDEVRDVRILVDTSSVEVFVNDGELVMSTRWYPEHRSCAIAAPGAQIACWSLAATAVR